MVLVLDATTLGERWTILSISVVIRSCAIPVAWKVLGGHEKGSWRPHWEGLLKHLDGCIPTDWQVLVMADRGLYARLVEQEAVEAMHQQNPLADLGASARRNIVVHDCSLAQLVGRTFRIGNVTLRGLTPRKKDEAFSEPSENVVPPFMRAERGQQAASCRMIPPQAHLRAEVLTEGTICVGDRVVLIQEV
jgi:hypothetical protein